MIIIRSPLLLKLVPARPSSAASTSSTQLLQRVVVAYVCLQAAAVCTELREIEGIFLNRRVHVRPISKKAETNVHHSFLGPKAFDSCCLLTCFALQWRCLKRKITSTRRQPCAANVSATLLAHFAKTCARDTHGKNQTRVNQ